MAFQADNVFLRLKLTLADLCALDAIKGLPEIKPEHAPSLISVEPVRERSAPATAPQTATRYGLVFPGSGYLRIAVKVEETTPSVSQEIIEKYGGAIPVKIEGFTSGAFETSGGGARPYFKAAKITPILPK